MNKYQVSHIDLSPDQFIEADSIDVMETGQICFYRKVKEDITTTSMCEIIKVGETEVNELVAVFPAGCAVMKVEDSEQEIFEKAKKKIEERNDFSVPAGESVSVQYHDCPTNDIETEYNFE